MISPIEFPLNFQRPHLSPSPVAPSRPRSSESVAPRPLDPRLADGLMANWRYHGRSRDQMIWIDTGYRIGYQTFKYTDFQTLILQTTSGKVFLGPQRHLDIRNPIWLHIHLNMYICKYLRLSFVHIGVCIYVYIHICIYIYTYIYIYIYKQM